jgi:hypothetical protein
MHVALTGFTVWYYFDHSGSADDGVHRIPQIVRDHSEHLVADSRRPLGELKRIFQLCIELLQLRVSASCLGARRLLRGELARLLFRIPT